MALSMKALIQQSAIVLVVCVSFSVSQQNTCPFTNSDAEAIAVAKILDSIEDDKVVWNNVLPDSNVVVESVEFPSTDSQIRPFVKPYFFKNDNGTTSIFLHSIQPAITDHVDIAHGNLDFLSQAPAYGLQIKLQGSPSPMQCRFRVSLQDDNNRVPEFDPPAPLVFNITRTYDISLPLNWDTSKRLTAVDRDRTKVQLSIIEENNMISGIFTPSPDTTKLNYTDDVLLFLTKDFDFTSDKYETYIKLSDGKNTGEPLRVTINVAVGDYFDPSFESRRYYYAPETIPEQEDTFTVELKVCDRDEGTDCKTDGYEFGVEDNELVTYEAGVFKFKTTGSTFAGLEEDVTLTAKQTLSNKTTTAILTIAVPENRPFPKDPLKPIEGPLKGQLINLPTLGSDVDYIVERWSLPDVEIEGVFEQDPEAGENTWKFTQDISKNDLGGYKDNQIIVLELKAKSRSRAPRVVATTTVIIPLKLDDDTTTTTDPSEPTESTDSSSCPPCATTLNPSTECPPSSEPATTSDSPLPSQSSECPLTCPTTSPPSESSPTSDKYSPSTPSECEPTECPISCPTLPPSSECPPTVSDSPSSSSEPCICNTTPIECTPTPPIDPSTQPGTTASDNPSNFPITDPTSTSPNDCTPEPCICSTTGITPPDCSSDKPGESCECDETPGGAADQKDDKDCSNTGLLAALIAVSVLLAIAICAGGYVYFLYRRSNSVQHEQYPTEETPYLSPIPPFSTTGPNDGDYKHNDFGDSDEGLVENAYDPQPEPGYTNPSYTEPIVEESTPIVEPEPVVVAEQPVKKSNIKTPKEIEPDYEERVDVDTTPPPVSEEPPRERKQSRVLFATKDEYFDDDDDVQDERL